LLIFMTYTSVNHISFLNYIGLHPLEASFGRALVVLAVGVIVAIFGIGKRITNYPLAM